MSDRPEETAVSLSRRGSQSREELEEGLLAKGAASSSSSSAPVLNQSAATTSATGALLNTSAASSSDTAAEGHQIIHGAEKFQEGGPLEIRYNPNLKTQHTLDFTGAVKQVRIPTLASGCLPFLLMVAGWVVWTVVLPVVLSAVRSSSGDPSSILLILSLVAAGTGVFFLLFSLRRTLASLCRKHKDGPQSPSLHDLPLRDAARRLQRPGEDPGTCCWTSHGSGGVEKKRIWLIVNPACGKKMAEQMVDSVIAPFLRENNIEWEETRTVSQAHAFELVKQKEDLQTFNALAIVGGDGSYHEVVNGMLSRSDGVGIPIALLPMGSSNATICDFLFAPQCVEQEVGGESKQRVLWNEGMETMEKVVRWSLQRLLKGEHVSVCVIEARTAGSVVRAVNAVYLGLMGDMNLVSEQLRSLGPVRYDVAGIACLLKKDTEAARVRWKKKDGSVEVVEGGLALATLDLIQHWKDDMRVAAAAQINAGYGSFFFVPASGASRDQLLSTMLQLNRASHLHNLPKGWRAEPTDSVVMEFDQPGVFSADGEQFVHDGKIEFSIRRPEQLRLVVGEEDVLAAGRPTLPAFAQASE